MFLLIENMNLQSKETTMKGKGIYLPMNLTKTALLIRHRNTVKTIEGRFLHLEKNGNTKLKVPILLAKTTFEDFPLMMRH